MSIHGVPSSTASFLLAARKDSGSANSTDEFPSEENRTDSWNNSTHCIAVDKADTSCVNPFGEIAE